MDNQQHTTIGTIGGTLLVLLTNLVAGDILKTVTLAFVGATTSFIVSHGWQYFVRRWKEKRKSKDQET